MPNDFFADFLAATAKKSSAPFCRPPAATTDFLAAGYTP